MMVIQRVQSMIFSFIISIGFLIAIPSLALAENVTVRVVFATEELPMMPMFLEVATEQTLVGTHTVESLGFFQGMIAVQGPEITSVDLLVPQEMFMPDQDRIRVYTDNCNYFDGSLFLYDFPYIGTPIVLAGAGGPIVMGGGDAKVPCKDGKYETAEGASVSVPAGKTVKYCWNATKEEKKAGSRTKGDTTTYFKDSIIDAAKAMLAAMGVATSEANAVCEKNRKCNTNAAGNRCRPESIGSDSSSVSVTVTTPGNSCFVATVPAPTESDGESDDPDFSGKVVCGCH